MQVLAAVDDVDPGLRGDGDLVNAGLRRGAEREVPGVGRREFRRPLRRPGKSGGRKRRELQRRRDIVGEPPAVLDRRPVDARQGGALALERPLERGATGRLLGGGETRPGRQRRRQKPAGRPGSDVTAAPGLFRDAGLAACRSLTAASSCVSLSSSGGT